MGKNASADTKAKDDKDKVPSTLVNFDKLPDSANVRLPTVAGLKGCSPATVWRYVKSGLIPKPKKIGPRITAWNVGELRASLKAAAGKGA